MYINNNVCVKSILIERLKILNLVKCYNLFIVLKKMHFNNFYNKDLNNSFHFV